MATTIQISKELKDALAKLKFSGKDTYEDIIWDLFEDTMEISNETKGELAKARTEAT